MPDLTIITPTRDAHRCFAMCERWMANQTYPVADCQWIVVDDGDNPVEPTLGQTYVRRQRKPDDPSHTLGENLLAAIPLVEGRRIAFVEQDDYYGPRYLQRCMEVMDAAKTGLIGVTRHVKYNVRDRMWWRNDFHKHGSLCTTVMHRDHLPALAKLCRTHNPFIDLALWQKRPGYLVESLSPGWPVCVGVKCMPGYTSDMTLNGRLANRTTKSKGTHDPDLSRLRQWIGDDADAYAEFHDHDVRQHAG